VALLGWGSLLWDVRLEFDYEHVPWNNDGPTVPLEFSRISTTRACAPTLVIDPERVQRDHYLQRFNRHAGETRQRSQS
jgi:hypothetical protein